MSMRCVRDGKFIGLSYRFNHGFRFAEHPGDGNARGEILAGPDQRTAVEDGIVQRVPSGEAADPEIPVALAEGDEELDAGIASAGAVSGSGWGGKCRIDSVEVFVVAT